MSKFSNLRLRAAGAGAVVAVAAIGLASMGAGNAAAGALPNGYKQTGGVAGESIQVWRSGESAFPVPTPANNFANRSAVTSGTYTAKTSKGVTGKITLNYIVGCQVDITGLELGLGGSISLASAGLSGSLTLPLKPGEVKVVSDVEDKDIKKGVASLQTSNMGINVSGCGGYASARSAVQVVGGKGYNTDKGTINGTGTYLQTTLYGQPFTLN